jgi:seryl-tRNA synthetase
MTDDPNIGGDPPAENPAPPPVDEKTSIDSLPPDIQAYIRDLRQEAKANREKLEAQQRKQTQEAEAAHRKEAEEQGRYQDIIAELEPKAQRAAELEQKIAAYFSERKEQLLKSVPEDRHDLIPPGALEDQVAWIEKAMERGLFGENKRIAPKTDAGATGDRRESFKLTAEELEYARTFDLTPEEYAKFKNAPQAGIPNLPKNP